MDIRAASNVPQQSFFLRCTGVGLNVASAATMPVKGGAHVSRRSLSLGWSSYLVSLEWSRRWSMRATISCSVRRSWGFAAHKGVQIAGSPLWLDATERKALSFVSSAWQPLRVRHKQQLATPLTMRLLRRRSNPSGSLIVPFNHPFALGPMRLELMPAGGLAGASQLSVELESSRFVYAQRLGPQEGCTTALGPQVRRCDVLVLDPDGLNLEAPTPLERQRHDLLEVVKASCEEKPLTVILVAASPWVIELSAWLIEAGIRPLVHRSLTHWLKAYEQLERTLVPRSKGKPEGEGKPTGRGSGWRTLGRKKPQPEEVVLLPGLLAATNPCCRCQSEL